MTDFTIDVIIPCYNAHKTLPRALASVAMQTIADRVTVTLVDDCSPDGGYEDIVKQFEGLLKIETITLLENGGPGVARQEGVNETDGDFICFMDADDTLCSSFALYQMARTMIENDMDVVSGQFIEELENGNFFVHPKNLIWVFGKLYRRSFLDRFLIRFNETRCNEDTGFNALINALTKRIEHIPQTVYMWHFAENTITRNNKGEYTFAHGHRGYIENMIWAAKEIDRRGLNREIYRRHVVTVLCRLYFMHEDVLAHAPEEGSDLTWQAQSRGRKYLKPQCRCLMNCRAPDLPTQAIRQSTRTDRLPFSTYCKLNYIHTAIHTQLLQQEQGRYRQGLLPWLTP